jgi:hypothetical protein
VFRDDRIVDGTVPPLFEIDHDDGVCAITGGVVYRGTRLPRLKGAYVYADLCRDGLRALRATTPTAGIGSVRDEREVAGTSAAHQVISIGTDAQGEVYLLSLDGAIRRVDPTS